MEMMEMEMIMKVDHQNIKMVNHQERIEKVSMVKNHDIKVIDHQRRVINVEAEVKVIARVQVLNHDLLQDHTVARSQNQGHGHLQISLVLHLLCLV